MVIDFNADQKAAVQWLREVSCRPTRVDARITSVILSSPIHPVLVVTLECLRIPLRKAKEALNNSVNYP